MKIMQEHVGKSVFAIPTGNNASRRGSQQQHEEFHVLSVGRRYAELQRSGSGYATKYDRETGATQCSVKSGHEGNAGYIFFDSVKAVNDYQRKGQRLQEIREFFRGYSLFKSLSHEEVKVIHSIIADKQ